MLDVSALQEKPDEKGGIAAAAYLLGDSNPCCRDENPVS
jgi:hypothetical protein